MVLFRQMNLFLIQIKNKRNSFHLLKRLLSHLHRSYSKESSDAEDSVKFDSRVGLIIDAKINTRSKLFVESFTKSDSPFREFYVNTDVLPVTLPILKRCCVEAGILTALACNCSKHTFSKALEDFNYDAYQANPQFLEIASDGYINFILSDKENEDDTYQCSSSLKYLKLKYNNLQSSHISSGNYFVDLFQIPIGRMKFVFEPNLKNGSEAAGLVKELIGILEHLDTCSLENEGTFRIDASISVNRTGDTFGLRTKVTNVKSPKLIQRAIDFKIERQIKNLNCKKSVMMETENCEYATKSIFFQDNEMAQEYFRMDDFSNVAPEKMSNEVNVTSYSNIFKIDNLQNMLPVLPEAQRCNLIEVYKLPLSIVDGLVKHGLSEAFEFIASLIEDKSLIYSFLLNNILNKLNFRKVHFRKCDLSVVQIAEIIELLHFQKISIESADDILEMLLNGDQRSAKDIVESYNWYIIYEGTELEELCSKVLHTHTKEAKKYKKTGKRYYMGILLTALSEIKNRSSLIHAEEVFKQLIQNRKIRTKLE